MNLYEKKKKLLKNYFLYFLFFLFIGVVYDLFLNTYIILNKKYEERMIFYGGYCDKQGYGFTKYIYEKYAKNIDVNIDATTVASPFQFAPPQAYFYNYNKKLSDKYLILLNPSEEDLKINYYSKGYKVIEKKGNCFFATKVN
jgi:hypothetical protein